MNLISKAVATALSASLLSACDPSGFGCSHEYVFIPTMNIDQSPISRRYAKVFENDLIRVETSSYSPSFNFHFSVTVDNHSPQPILVSKVLGYSVENELIESQSTVFWQSHCLGSECREGYAESSDYLMQLMPKDSGRIDTEIQQSDVAGLNRINHKIDVAMGPDQEPDSVSWSMVRAERRINCIFGKGHDYRLVN